MTRKDQSTGKRRLPRRSQSLLLLFCRLCLTAHTPAAAHLHCFSHAFAGGAARHFLMEMAPPGLEREAKRFIMSSVFSTTAASSADTSAA